MKEHILYGVRVGDEDWQEQIISTNPAAFTKASEWATANGFDRLRVAVIDLTVAPDFGGCVR